MGRRMGWGGGEGGEGEEGRTGEGRRGEKRWESLTKLFHDNA